MCYIIVELFSGEHLVKNVVLIENMTRWPDRDFCGSSKIIVKGIWCLTLAFIDETDYKECGFTPFSNLEIKISFTPLLAYDFCLARP